MSMNEVKIWILLILVMFLSVVMSYVGLKYMVRNLIMEEEIHRIEAIEERLDKLEGR